MMSSWERLGIESVQLGEGDRGGRRAAQKGAKGQGPHEGETGRRNVIWGVLRLWDLGAGAVDSVFGESPSCYLTSFVSAQMKSKRSLALNPLFRISHEVSALARLILSLPLEKTHSEPVYLKAYVSTSGATCDMWPVKHTCAVRAKYTPGLKTQKYKWNHLINNFYVVSMLKWYLRYIGLKYIIKINFTCIFLLSSTVFVWGRVAWL